LKNLFFVLWAIDHAVSLTPGHVAGSFRKDGVFDDIFSSQMPATTYFALFPAGEPRLPINSPARLPFKCRLNAGPRWSGTSGASVKHKPHEFPGLGVV